MMKVVKCIIVIGVVFCAAYSSYVISETNDLLRERNNPLTFAEVESLASGEIGDIVDPCHSVKYYKSTSYQNCVMPNGVTLSLPRRENYEVKCEGTDNGYCEAGMIYEHFDCLGYRIYSEELTSTTKCQ